MDFHEVSPKLKPVKNGGCILVLWGEYFDEAATTIFTVTLRQAGLCVKVVGVNGMVSAGRNGLALHADIALSDAIALIPEVTCLILPCSRAAVRRLENDPRIHELFAGVTFQQAKWIVPEMSVIQKSILNLLSIPEKDIAAYDQTDELVSFAKEIAAMLSFVDPEPACAAKRVTTKLPSTMSFPILEEAFAD